MVETKRNFKFYLFVFLKGIFIGLISLGIPGLSASTIAIVLGIYFLMAESIANIFKNFKQNSAFLLTLMLGYGLGAIGAAFSITILFEKFPLITTLAIIGLIAGTIFDMIRTLKGNFKSISNWIVFVVVLAGLLVYGIIISKSTELTFPDSPKLFDLIKMAIIGVVTSSTFIIPGVDFAVMFMSLGIYYPFMNMLTEIVSFGADWYLSRLLINLEILGFYLVGYFVGIFLFSKLIKFLIGKYAIKTQFASFAFVVAAPPVFIKSGVIDNPSFFITIPQLIVAIIVCIICFMIIYKLNDYKNKNEKEMMINKIKEG